MTALLQLDSLQVPVEIGGTSRSVKLTIDADGALRLRAAEDMTADELYQFLVSKRDWVYQKLAEKEALQHEHITKELVDGEGFSYLGRNYRLKLVETAGAVRLDHGRLVLPKYLLASRDAALVAWYRRCGEAWLAPRGTSWAERLSVDDVPITVADLANKWGSATPGRWVRIHWATLQLPPALVEYVLAHELAHLRETHHGPAFWQLLGRVMPDYEERKRELARRGARLWFGRTS